MHFDKMVTGQWDELPVWAESRSAAPDSETVQVSDKNASRAPSTVGFPDMTKLQGGEPGADLEHISSDLKTPQHLSWGHGEFC